jgi:hypothetical protein
MLVFVSAPILQTGAPGLLITLKVCLRVLPPFPFAVTSIVIILSIVVAGIPEITPKLEIIIELFCGTVEIENEFVALISLICKFKLLPSTKR